MNVSERRLSSSVGAAQAVGRFSMKPHSQLRSPSQKALAVSAQLTDSSCRMLLQPEAWDAFLVEGHMATR